MTIRELTTRWLFKSDTKPITVLDNAVKRVKTSIAELDKKIKAAFGMAAKATVAGISAYAVASVKMASDAAESESKFEAVFKDEAKAAREWSNSLAKDIGRSSYDLRKFASGLQDTFVPLGMSRDVAAGLSKQLTELAIDVSSFSNVSEQETIESFTSAMVGNTEAVRKFGIVIQETQLKEKIKQLSKEMDGFSKMSKQQQKTFATYKLILESTTDAHGDAKRTAGGFANQMRALKAKVSEFTIEVGNKLLPIAAKYLGMLQKWFDANRELIKQRVEGAIELLGSALKTLGKVFAYVIEHAKAFGVALGVLIGGRMIFGLAMMAKKVLEIGRAFKAVTASSAGASAGIGGVVGKLGALAAAGAAGYQIGTMLDNWLGLSDKLSDSFVNAERNLSKLKAAQYDRKTSIKTLQQQALMYAGMLRRGQTSITDESGKRIELNKENVNARLASAAKRMGVSPEDMATQLPLMSKIAGFNGPGGKYNGQTVNAPITVNVPPGTDASMAQRTADAVGKAMPGIVRRALPAVR